MFSGQLLTGYGKRLTFQQFPAGVVSSLNAKGYKFSANPSIVVISPLNSILEDLVKYLRSLGIKAGYVGEGKTTVQEI